MNGSHRNNHDQTDKILNLRNIFLGFFCLNIIAVFVLYASTSELPSTQRHSELLMNNFQAISEPEPEPGLEINSYTFEEPFLAYHILKLIDEFEPVDPKYYDYLPTAKNWSSAVYMGLNIDEAYCDKHRRLFVSDPYFIFHEKNALMDWWSLNTVRNTSIIGVLNDLQPDVSAQIPAGKNSTDRYSWVSPRQNYHFTAHYLHVFLHFGKNFGCITQSYNHIPGNGHLNRKDLVSEAMVAYAGQYKDRPQCFSYEKAFPMTWVMYIEKQCRDFFDHFRSEEHTKLKAKNNIVYIRKVGAGAHNGKGVFLMDDEEEKNITEVYKNGEACGKNKDNIVIQYFIPNPLLLHGHKFHFRIYMFIASINPLIVYYYDGYVKLSLHKYEPNSSDKFSMISNTLASKDDIKAAMNRTLVNDMNETELQYFQRWNLDRLQDYLLENGEITDNQWIDNHLRPELKRTMVHLIRMTQDKFLVRSAMYEMFGVDFIMDENLNLWFIECNSSPSLAFTHLETQIFIKKLLTDSYELVIGLTRSRAKRIIKYINELTKTRGFQLTAEGELLAEGLEDMKKGFKKVIENGFEEEFMPSAENNYQMIIDERLEGPARYMGLLSEECLENSNITLSIE